MRKFYETEWFDIKFCEIAKLSTKQVANAEFYSAFYQSFYAKYNSYDDLPNSWRLGKDIVATQLENIIKAENKKRPLSIGCGIGYVEHRLAQLLTEMDSLSLTAIDPSVDVKQWCCDKRVKFVRGMFPECLSVDDDYDFTYVCNIDYVFSNEDYTEFIKCIFDYGIKDLLLTELSVQEKQPLKHVTKDSIIYLLSLCGFYDRGQLWGYRRTIPEHKKIVEAAGYSNIDIGQNDNGRYWMRCKID